MGRRGVRVGDEERWVFNRLAEDYRARPGYPPGLIDRLMELAGGAAGTVVDLGAGTGLVSLPLAARGAQVIAVEPAAAMLRVLEEAASPRVVAVHAAAESTGLSPEIADLAVLADALHWVEPGAAGSEIARIAKRGGAIALIEARPAPTPFMTQVTALVEVANVKARPSSSVAARREHLLRAAGAGRIGVEQFQHSVPLAPEQLEAVIRSLSVVGPAIGAAALEHLLREVRRVAADAAGDATWARNISLTWARLP